MTVRMLHLAIPNVGSLHGPISVSSTLSPFLGAVSEFLHKIVDVLLLQGLSAEKIVVFFERSQKTCTAWGTMRSGK